MLSCLTAAIESMRGLPSCTGPVFACMGVVMNSSDLMISSAAATLQLNAECPVHFDHARFFWWQLVCPARLRCSLCGFGLSSRLEGCTRHPSLH